MLAGREPLVACLLVSLALAGCADQGPEAGTVIEREDTIEPGSYLELNLHVNASAELVYRWSTTPATTLGFDLHSHEGQEVRYHDQADAAEHEGTFTPPEDAAYSLLWENPSEEPVTVAIHLEGEVEIASVAP